MGFLERDAEEIIFPKFLYLPLIVALSVWSVPLMMFSSDIVLVEDGQVKGSIVYDDDSAGTKKMLANEFASVVARSTGVNVPVAPAQSHPSPAGDTLYICSDDGGEVSKRLMDGLPPEGYRILVKGRTAYIAGNDQPQKAGDERSDAVSQPTRWALNSLLESQLGVRWLWPGTLGTYVPKSNSFHIPAQDTSYQPKLSIRRMRVDPKWGKYDLKLSEKETRLRDEGLDWAQNHQCGPLAGRDKIPFGHAFSKWWSKYGAAHPEYFAPPLAGLNQPPYDPKFVKIRLSSPEVIDRIAQEYDAAGRPMYWNVGENDGIGFDTTDETRAWDEPKNQSVDDIWNGRAALSARYVTFWNLVYERLVKLNPDVVLTAYAYGAYRNPPPPDRKLTAKMIIGVVDSLSAYTPWVGWGNATGADLYLRPNWFHGGQNAPYLPIDELYNYLKFAWASDKMMGIDMDSVMGFWATQGLNYYLVARMISRPDLSKEAIVGEYVSAFGQAAPEIAEYISYWQAITRIYTTWRQNAATLPAILSPGSFTDPEKKKAALQRQAQPGVANRLAALPELYSDEIIAPGLAILDRAEHAVKDSDPEVLAKVRFLKDGLKELVATRDLIAAAQKVQAVPEADLIASFRAQAAALETFRDELSDNHAIWGATATRWEDIKRVPMRPRNMKLPQLNEAGME